MNQQMRYVLQWISAVTFLLSGSFCRGAESPRLEWNLTTSLVDYRKHGQRDAKWDKDAELALTRFAEIRATGSTNTEPLLEPIKRARDQGCDDPMIKYLYARFQMPKENHSSAEYGQIYREIAEAMNKGQRSPFRRFYAAIRASENSNMGTVAAVAGVQQWRRSAREALKEAVADKTTPVQEVFEAWDLLLTSSGKKKTDYDESYFALEPTVFKNWPHEPLLLLTKGTFYTDYAWEARGSGYADSVTAEGASLFVRRLEIAQHALEEAWKLNPKDERIARRMITVELGQGQGRKRMEQWFERAMALNTNYYDACYAKLYYLTPKWYGSREELLTFAAECLNSSKWGGRVPLIVIDAHQIISETYRGAQRTDYCKRPEVWADIKQAFDKFFRSNPTATGWHHDYALYAYRAGQWADFNRELGLFGTHTNYDYFGGKDQFDKMLKEAAAHSADTNTPAVH